MDVRKLHEQQFIQPTTNKPSTEVDIAPHEVQLRVYYQPEKGDVIKTEKEMQSEPAQHQDRAHSGSSTVGSLVDKS